MTSAPEWPAWAGPLWLAAAILLATGPALAQPQAPVATVACALQPGPAQAAGAQLRLELVIDCSSGVRQAQPLPRDTALLAGLTLYGMPRQPVRAQQGQRDFERRELQAPPEVAAALGNGVASRGLLVAGQPRWIVLEDGDAASYDVAAQPLKIARAGERQRLVFSVPAAEAARYPHLLFALWPQTAREPCDKTERGVRSGCQREGYVLEGDPLAVYPGREINFYSHPSGDWTAERWIVERWR